MVSSTHPPTFIIVSGVRRTRLEFLGPRERKLSLDNFYPSAQFHRRDACSSAQLAANTRSRPTRRLLLRWVVVPPILAPANPAQLHARHTSLNIPTPIRERGLRRFPPTLAALSSTRLDTLQAGGVAVVFSTR